LWGGVLALPLHGQGRFEAALAGGKDSGRAVDHRAARGMGARSEGDSNGDRKKFKYPVFVKPATLGSSWNVESAFEPELGGARFARNSDESWSSVRSRRKLSFRARNTI